MTNLKVCTKIRLFIIISAIVIVIGMAVGTVCHFLAGGFFNYGGEFASYKSVTVTYYTAEYPDVEDVKSVIEDALGDFNAYEVSYGDTNLGGEVVYKFSPSTDSAKLQSAVDTLNKNLDKEGSGLNVATLHEGAVNAGGAKNLVRAAIAFASAAAFMFLYYIVRYKLRAAYSALLACVHNLGLYVALAAITRIPLGTEAVAIGGIVIFVTMLGCGLLFDRTRRNFKDEKNAKAARLDVVEASAAEVRTLTFISVCAVACAAVILGVFAAISSLYIGALAPTALAVIAALSCAYGLMFFTPSVHGAIDNRCEKVRQSIKQKSAAKAAEKPTKKSKKEPLATNSQKETVTNSQKESL